jgi:hypothetical protein
MTHRFISFRGKEKQKHKRRKLTYRELTLFFGVGFLGQGKARQKKEAG